jgi:hypothetical protein
MIIEVVSMSETSLNFYQTTRLNILEHIRCEAFAVTEFDVVLTGTQPRQVYV